MYYYRSKAIDITRVGDRYLCIEGDPKDYQEEDSEDCTLNHL